MMMKKTALKMVAAGMLAGMAVMLVTAGCGSTETKTDAPTTDGKAPDGKMGETKPEGSKVAGQVTIDGSTTVYPISEKIADALHDPFPDIEVTVNKSGTGSGFKKFIAGEIDVTGASRPVEKEEDQKLKDAGIPYLEVPIAFDGVTVIVNPSNTFATKMTLAELKKAWAKGSTVTTWKDINPAWPADKITFYGPSDNHGTYEYFTEAVNGKKNEIRKEYQANQEYTAIVQSIAGDKNGIGYVGFNYFDENKDKVKSVAVDGVEPSADTIANGTYKLLSRPLFLYVSQKAYADKPGVKSLIDFALTEEGLKSVTEAKYVRLPADAYALIKTRVEGKVPGSKFMNATPGSKITDILK